MVINKIWQPNDTDQTKKVEVTVFSRARTIESLEVNLQCLSSNSMGISDMVGHIGTIRDILFNVSLQVGTRLAILMKGKLVPLEVSVPSP